MIQLLVTLALAVPSDQDFRPYHEDGPTQIEKAEVPSGPPWIRGKTEIPASLDAIQKVLIDFEHYKEFLDGIVSKATVLEKRPTGARLHFVYPYPFPFKDRDAVVSYSFERKKESLRVWWQSDPKPGDPSEGVRIERVAGQTLAERIEDTRSRVTFTYLGDLGGSFTESTRERAYKKEPPHYFDALKKALKPTRP